MKLWLYFTKSHGNLLLMAMVGLLASMVVSAGDASAGQTSSSPGNKGGPHAFKAKPRAARHAWGRLGGRLGARLGGRLGGTLGAPKGAIGAIGHARGQARSRRQSPRALPAHAIYNPAAPASKFDQKEYDARLEIQTKTQKEQYLRQFRRGTQLLWTGMRQGGGRADANLVNKVITRSQNQLESWYQRQLSAQESGLDKLGGKYVRALEAKDTAMHRAEQEGLHIKLLKPLKRSEVGRKCWSALKTRDGAKRAMALEQANTNLVKIRTEIDYNARLVKETTKARVMAKSVLGQKLKIASDNMQARLRRGGAQ